MLDPYTGCAAAERRAVKQIVLDKRGVMQEFTSNMMTKIAGTVTVLIILGLNGFLVVQLFTA